MESKHWNWIAICSSCLCILAVAVERPGIAVVLFMMAAIALFHADNQGDDDDV